MPRTRAEDSISRRFWFEHTSGARLYPYRVRNQRSGQLAFRVAPGAKGANRVESQSQLDDEEEVFQHVFGRGWSVRMRSLDGRIEGLYNKDGYSIVRTSEFAVASTRLGSSDYRDVLASLAVSDKARAFLVAHYYAPGRKASMEELALAVGYASYEPANLHYGRLGHSVADRLSRLPDDIGTSGYGNWVQSLAQATGEFNGDGHFLWTQRAEVASALESLGWVRPDQELEPQRAGAEQGPPVDGGTTRDAIVAARKGQQLFRHRVLQYWGGACSITGCRATGLLLASHIKPWGESTDDERLDGFNGLLLTPNLDRLFDQHLISFDDKGHVLIARSLSAEDRLALGVTTNLHIERLHERHLAYLSTHRDRFEAAEG